MRGYDEFGKACAAEARSAYSRWGAAAKVRQVEQRYGSSGSQPSIRHSTGGTSSTMTVAAIDLSALRKALKAIAEERIHTKMVERIIRAAVEFAGAQKGLLIFRKEAREEEENQMALTTDGAATLIGLLYFENNLTRSAFTRDRIETLEIISLAAAGRLELSRKAITDGLTGLYNHDYFQNMLGQELMLAKRKGRELSMIMIDIDHFKRFNDTWPRFPWRKKYVPASRPCAWSTLPVKCFM